MHGRKTQPVFGLTPIFYAVPMVRLCVVSFVLVCAPSLHAQDGNQRPVFEDGVPLQTEEDVPTEASNQVFDQEVTVYPQEESSEPTIDGENFQLGFLIEMVRELQEDNSRMLGRLEKLEHQVQLLRHENRDRYEELDDRLMELSGQTTVSPGAISTASPDSEAGMYRTAFTMIEDGEYKEAVQLLESMVKSYPNGDHLPDAFYWLGETYVRMDPRQLEMARQNLVQLYRMFPQHSKTPEGIYKLGTIYDQLGDQPKALEYLERVVNDYPNTTAARLAEDYAKTLQAE